MRISEVRETPFLTLLRCCEGRTVPHGKAYRQLPPQPKGRMEIRMSSTVWLGPQVTKLRAERPPAKRETPPSAMPVSDRTSLLECGNSSPFSCGIAKAVGPTERPRSRNSNRAEKGKQRGIPALPIEPAAARSDSKANPPIAQDHRLFQSGVGPARFERRWSHPASKRHWPCHSLGSRARLRRMILSEMSRTL